jgi:2-polyprenyl-3-methyl-5-hydroxy-6-metoxy-1,4-benzoquinol methylase
VIPGPRAKSLIELSTNSCLLEREANGLETGWLCASLDRLYQGRYLDAGCRNGFMTEWIAPRFNEVVGIDVEEMQLEEFRAHASVEPNFKVLRMSAAKIAFAAEFFSFVTSFEVLEHLPDLDAAVREILRAVNGDVS